MYANMHARIAAIAEEDFERETELGESCPSTLKIILANGHIIDRVSMIDSVNSVDDETIDVNQLEHRYPGSGQCWTIATSQIAAIEQTYPTDRQREEAAAAGAKRKADRA